MGNIIENRETCKSCGNIITRKEARTYCDKSCRNKAYNRKLKAKQLEWHRKERAKVAAVPSKDKKQCLICGGWYVQVCSHVVQRHGITAREYQEIYDLEVKRGVVPEWFREKKGKIALENGTYRNLESGKEYRFKKGQEGLGRYERSHITIERLRDLHKKRRK